MEEAHAGAKVARVLDGGEHVSVHFTFEDSCKSCATIDVIRFEGGEVAERMENVQEMSGEPNPSGHTMADGPAEPDYSTR